VVGHNNMRAQGILGERKMGNMGGMGACMGMEGHERWECHTNKGGSLGKVQFRCTR